MTPPIQTTMPCPHCRESRQVEVAAGAPGMECVTAAAPCVAGCAADAEALEELTAALRAQLDAEAIDACYDNRVRGRPS